MKRDGQHGRIWPFVLAGVCCALALAGLAMNLTHPNVENLIDGHEIGDALMCVAAATVAALILRRLPRQPVGLTFAAIAFFDGLSLLNGGLGDMLPAASVGATVVQIGDQWLWIPGLWLTIGLLPLVFPSGVESRWLRWTAAAGILIVVVACIANATGSLLQVSERRSIANPIAVPGADVVGFVALAAGVAFAVFSIVVLVLRFVRATGIVRRQIAPLLLAGALVIVAASVATLLGRVGTVLQDVCTLLVPVAALVAILRLRLYALETAIMRTTQWVILSGLLLGAYVLVVQVATHWLRLPGPASSIIATVAVVLALAPLRALLQRVIVRRLYGDRGDPYAALTHTTKLLEGGADPLGALEQAAADLATRLRCSGVRILRADAILAGVNEGAGMAAIAVPLRSGDAVIGRLEVLPRGPGEGFSRADQELILELARPIAATVASIGLAEELRAATERLAFAREEERRRLRIELHDDVGPTIAALGIQAGVALKRIERADLVGATDTLRLLQRTGSQASGDLRAVIDALGPRAVEDSGLSSALRELATTHSTADLTVTASVAADRALPAAIETAVYRVAAEALTNAVRHSGGDTASIDFRSDGDLLRLVVTDNGRAASLSRRAGIGIPSMRARMAEIGGVLTIVTGTAGTTLVAEVALDGAQTTAAG
jgi:signal transduction histidine kinase